MTSYPASYPADIRRCQHIKTNGTQCASPALRKNRFCYYHDESRPERIKVKGCDGKTSQILVPLFEDASSIQMMVRQVAVLLLQDKIDSKKAGQLLHALRIASSNLKRAEEEKPRPVQVVVDPKKVGETPLESTPWSSDGQGHEADNVNEEVAWAKWRYKKQHEWWMNEYETRKTWMVTKAQELAEWVASNKETSSENALQTLRSTAGNLGDAALSMSAALVARFGDKESLRG